MRLAAGLAAYAAQEWNEALSELRAARRITGRPEHLAVLADCERALGRPERALTYGDDPEVTSLSQDERVELVIVLAGARRDMGQFDAAVLALQTPARATTAKRPWAARLWYAFADALLAAGRHAEAREWFARTAGIDDDGQTDAADRVLELDGIVLEDLADDEDERDAVDGMDDAALAAYVAEGFVGIGDVAGTDAVADAVDDAADKASVDKASAGQADTGAAESKVGEPEPDRSSPGPFSSAAAQAEPATTARPAAALTPTFAAPAQEDDRGEGGSPTL